MPSLLRFLPLILALGVFAKFSWQISVSNDVTKLLVSSTSDLFRLDDLAVHVAEEKAGKVERLEQEIASLRARLEQSQRQGLSSNAIDGVQHCYCKSNNTRVHNSAQNM